MKLQNLVEQFAENVAAQTDTIWRGDAKTGNTTGLCRALRVSSTHRPASPERPRPIVYAPASVRLPTEELKIGKYQVLQRLASGGMGEVFLALQEGPANFLRKVVIKRMRSPIGEDPVFVEMFLNEARLAALLSHPNVVHILELGSAEDGSWFIAMEHIHGRSLREVLMARNQRDTPGLPPELAARLCADILRGLHHAHEMRDAQGKQLEIIHRDVSPENVLVSFSGTVKVVDFGIAKAMAEASSITHVSQLKGKVPYLAPEQLRLERVEARTDVYATGCVLYEMLSGKSAFPTHPNADLMEEVLTSMPIPLSTLRPHIPEALGAIALKAMAKSPADRFASAQEMATALEGFLLEAQVRVPPEEVSSFLAKLFGAPAAAPPTATGIPHAAPRETAPLASTPEPHPPELPTDLELTQQEVPLGRRPEPPAARLLGVPPSVELRRVTSAVPALVAEEPTDRYPAEPNPHVAEDLTARYPAELINQVAEDLTARYPAELITQVAGSRRLPLEPARVELPAGGAPAQRSAWHWSSLFVAAIVVGLVLTVLGAGGLQPGSEPPTAASPEALAPAGSEPWPELAPLPTAAEASREEDQGGSAPPPADPAWAPTHQAGKARPPPTGRVVMHVRPSAEIFIGSQRLGRTSVDPFEIELPAGPHTLTLKSAELGVTRRIRVKVPVGGKVAIRENLGRPASLGQ
jgi:serine/threonine protein kinase